MFSQYSKSNTKVLRAFQMSLLTVKNKLRSAPCKLSRMWLHHILPVFNSIDFQASCATPGRLDTCSMAALNRVKIYTGYGSEILELSLDIPANPGGGEVLPDPDHRQRNEGLHSSGSGYTCICRSWHDKLDIL